ncbi:MAG: DUF459 domain-containing protein [Myxococcota bacterium]
MSKVFDKYRVVDVSVRTLTRPWVVGVSFAAFSAFLALYGSAEIRSFVSAKESLPAHETLLAVATGLDNTSKATGVAWVRGQIDAVTAPLQRTHKVLARGVPEPVGGPVLVDGTDVSDDTDLPVGQRWVGPEDPGGDRIERVLIVGASSIQYHLGIELQRTIEEHYPGVTVHRLGKLGTGLVRDDVFDWDAEIATLMATHSPDLVVAQFGGNDAQALTLGETRIGFGKEGWDDAYRQRLVTVATHIQDAGAQPLFLGMPVMRESGFSGRIKRVNRITEEAMNQVGARYVPTWDLAATPTGKYRVAVEHEGRRGTMRMQDGVHYTRLGAKFVASHLTTRLEQQMPLIRAGDAATAVHVRLESKARGKTVPYMAIVPHDVPDEGLPALMLLHGAWDSWTSWSNHNHAALKQLAAEHKVVLLFPDGEPFGWYLDSDKVPGNQIATHLVEEVWPDAQERLPLNGRLSLMGLSMGGHGALVTALRNPGLATSVSSMSGAIDLAAAKSRTQLQELLGPYDDDPDAWHAWSAAHLFQAYPERAADLPIRLHCGDADKRWTEPNRALHAQLEAQGITHVWEEVKGGHTWPIWSAALPEHVAWHAEHLAADR